MTNKAFQRIYTQLEAITKATVSLRAQGVSNDELATVAGRLAQVVKIKDDLVTLSPSRSMRAPRASRPTPR